MSAGLLLTLVSFSHAVFLLFSFFTKTFKMYTLHPSTVVSLIFICTKNFLNWGYVFVLTRTHIKLKQLSLKLSLGISIIHDILSNFFLFHLKEKCLPRKQVYWFPISNQQSRQQCFLGIHSLSWNYVCECLNTCIPVTTTQRSSLIIVLCVGGCLGGIIVVFRQLWPLTSLTSHHSKGQLGREDLCQAPC